MSQHPLFAGIGGHHHARATTDEWLTPLPIIDAMGGADSFDLDPAASVVRPWPTARHHYTLLDNGLILPWEGRVWLNPPYGRTLGKWTGRMAGHGRGVMLIFARTDTEAFRQHVWGQASALFFIFGRIDFLDTAGKPRQTRNGRDANSGAPSVLCAYGWDDADVLAGCGLEGHFVPLRLPASVAVLALETTWSEVIGAFMAASDGPVALADIYRAFASHPKARRNRNHQAKIRQILQTRGFRRVDRGLWAHPLKETACS